MGAQLHLRPALQAFAVASAIKLLLAPYSYRSTDFEVHRNWLAVTYSTPLRRWYHEDTSEWTLDYPPFFALFEWLLSLLAARVDPKMIEVSAKPYASHATVMFQRLSVMASDVVLLVGVLANSGTSRAAERAASVLILLSAGLLMVDHIHFQYNGMLLGLLLLSAASIRKGRHILGAILFASLLMFKHLFLSVAPLYFVFLLRHYCFSHPGTPGAPPSLSLQRFLSLALSVLGVFAAGFVPFLILAEQGPVSELRQMLKRLLPFGRGLVHAYWAPNVWAFYCLGDVVTAQGLKKVGKMGPPAAPTFTSGLVQDVQAEVLPTVTPPITALLTLASMVPAMMAVWRDSSRTKFVYGLFHASLCAFMLGWHVHEKAIIVPVVLLALLALEDPTYARLYLRLATVGHASLLPLFPTLTPDALSAWLLLHAHTAASYVVLLQHYHPGESEEDGTEVKAAATEQPPLLGWVDWVYFWGLEAVLLLHQVIHPVWLEHRLPFLGRMAMSVYCGVGILLVWMQSYGLLFNPVKHVRLKGS